MSCTQCRGIERQFDDTVARRELRRYRRRGPSKTTRMLIDRIVEEGAEGRSFLDVGGGIGAIQLDLMAAGASGGTHADASPAYLAVSRAEAESRGHADRILYIEGDFVEMKNEIDPADIVTLDRVVCCYPDLQGLMTAAAERTRRTLGVVFPREMVLTRIGISLINLVQRLRRHPFRVFLHATNDVLAIAESQGLEKRSHRHSTLWQIVVFTRRDVTPADAQGS